MHKCQVLTNGSACGFKSENNKIYLFTQRKHISPVYSRTGSSRWRGYYLNNFLTGFQLVDSSFVGANS